MFQNTTIKLLKLTKQTTTKKWLAKVVAIIIHETSLACIPHVIQIEQLPFL